MSSQSTSQTAPFNDPDARVVDPGEQGSEERETYLAVRVGAVWYAVVARDVAQIVPQAAAVPVPGTPPFVLGLLSSGGSIITLLDPTPLLAVPRAGADVDEEVSSRDVILTHAGMRFALRVDDVASLVEVPIASLRKVEDESGIATQVFADGQRVVTVLDVGRLLEVAEERVGGVR